MKIETRTCVRVGVSILLLYLCIHYWPTVANLLSTAVGAASPLLIGCAVAYIINILMAFYEKHYFPRSGRPLVCKSRRPVCLLAAFVTLVAMIALVIVLIVPQLTACVQLLLAELPNALRTLVSWLERLNILPEDIVSFLEEIDWKSRINQIVSLLTSGISNVLGAAVGVLSSVFSGVVSALLSLIFAVYLLLGRDRLARQCDRLLKRYLRESWYARLRYVTDILNDCFHRYIVGQCTEAVILGLLCALGMWILRLPYAAMIGALIAFTALIPVAGAYIGGAVGAFMILTVSPVKAVIFVVFLVILQQVEGNLIYPRVVGSSMGLPGIWVLAAVTIGGGMLGIAGMLLGVPLAAAVYRILKNDLANQAVQAPAGAPDEAAPDAPGENPPQT